MIVEFTDSHYERVLYGMDIALPVLFVAARILRQLNWIDPALELQLSINRHESVSKREDSDDQDDHENCHTN